MFRMQIVIEKDCVVIIRAQEVPRLRDIVSYINHIAFEARCKPLVPSSIVIQQKDADRVALSSNAAETKFAQQ